MKTRDCVSGAHRAGMVIVLRNGTVNRILRSVDNPRETGTFAISPASARASRVYGGFIAIVKRPFKFVWS
jgi:hypothetical protein